MPQPTTTPFGGVERAPCVLLVHDLLAEDIRMPAVLGKLAQHVEVYPAHWERATPVAMDHFVQVQGRCRAP